MAGQSTHTEPHNGRPVSRLNSLRAAVLGANDGIVSVAGIVVGVAGASASGLVIFTSGLAGLAAGALSMAAGEYVSVSSQRDTERALLNKERAELRDFPREERNELEQLYIAKGLSRDTAKRVADELTAKDAFAAHAEVELKIDPEDLTNPWQAAIASALSFLVGAVIPLVTVVIAPAHFKVAVTFVAVIIALTLTGVISAKVGEANRVQATLRVVIGGVIAMAVTFMIGKLVGVSLH